MIEHEELKPCPFCGGKAEIHYISIGIIRKRTGCYVKCELCRASSGAEFDENKVAEKWNRRTDDGKLISN